MMRFYSLLLYLYPTSFRGEYAAELRALFKARLRQTSGFVARVTLWAETILDVVANATAAHLDILWQDLRYTARTLGRTPGFTLTAILVTALGIGANTAAFSVADFVLIRPLPFKDSERLVKVWEAPPGYGQLEAAPAIYRDWKTMSRSFDGMAAFHSVAVNLVGQGDPQRLAGSAVTADLMPILGVPPLFGRWFTAAEERAGADGTVLLSHGLWQRQFGADPSVLGRHLILDGNPRVVIGVMPKEFHFPTSDVALWTPMALDEQLDEDRSNNWFEVIARLRPGVTLEQAQADMNLVAQRLEQQWPKELEKIGANVYPLREEFSERSRLLLLALCGAAACVLLIACANLANLLLARAMVRRKELLVRTALGAGRERLLRQSVTESLVLAGLGGGLGIVIAGVSVPLLTRLVPTSLPIAQAPSVDGRVMIFAGLLAVVTGIVFGVIPAWRASGSLDLSGLRDGGRSGGGRRDRMRSVLVIAEVMASVVLLISSGLLMRALWRIQATDPGFKPENVLTMRTALPQPKYDTVTRRVVFYDEVLNRVRAIPGVSNAAYISFLPMAMGGGIWPVSVGAEVSTRASEHTASMRFTSPGYFNSLGIPIRKGRDVSVADDAGQPFVAVVSESFVKRYFPNEDPIGQRFMFGLGIMRTIVGVAGDVRVRGPERVPEPQVYLPYKQVADGNMPNYAPKDLVIRSSVPATTLVPAVRDIVRSIDAQQPISNIRMMTEIVSDQTASRAVQVRVLSGFAALAFLLAAVGIHGLLSYAVSTRQQEIGVRIALGAQRSQIVAMVMRQGALLATAGVIPGVIIAYAAGRAMRGLLAGVEPSDPSTFAAAAGLCVVMTLLGTLLPVLRAVRVDPATAFRSEV